MAEFYDYKVDDDIPVLSFPGNEVLILNPQRCTTTINNSKGAHPGTDVIVISFSSNDPSRVERISVCIEGPAKLSKLIDTLKRLGSEIWGINQILDKSKN